MQSVRPETVWLLMHFNCLHLHRRKLWGYWTETTSQKQRTRGQGFLLLCIVDILPIAIIFNTKSHKNTLHVLKHC